MSELSLSNIGLSGNRSCFYPTNNQRQEIGCFFLAFDYVRISKCGANNVNNCDDNHIVKKTQKQTSQDKAFVMTSPATYFFEANEVKFS